MLVPTGQHGDVDESHILLTNNFAEQILRHWVIARKLSQGTRSYAGTRALGILASVIDTCNARSASSWRFIGKAIAAARVGGEKRLKNPLHNRLRNTTTAIPTDTTTSPPDDPSPTRHTGG